ncbi:MAG: molybdopterin-binding protein [Myxococcota bacterium]
MATAAALIIGDEILSGKFIDENSPWLIQRCRELGLSLKRLSIISDQLDDIADNVRTWSGRVDHVFTTGGVGPTHDDLTMKGVAQAFGVSMVRHPTLEHIIRTRFEGPINEDVLRMAEVPDGAILWEEEDLYFPQIVVHNVCIFPGVPRIFQKKFNAVSHRFSGRHKHSRRFVTAESETDIAARLRLLVHNHPDVSIGSYPRFDSKPYTVTVTLDSYDEIALNAAEQAMAQALTRFEPES